VSGTASTPQPPRPPAPGNMRPVHDGADPVDEARRRTEDRLATWLWRLTLAIFLVLGTLIGDPRHGWVWWVASTVIVGGVVLVLEFLVWPRVVRRLTPWVLARQDRRGGL